MVLKCANICSRNYDVSTAADYWMGIMGILKRGCYQGQRLPGPFSFFFFAEAERREDRSAKLSGPSIYLDCPS